MRSFMVSMITMNKYREYNGWGIWFIWSKIQRVHLKDLVVDVNIVLKWIL